MSAPTPRTDAYRALVARGGTYDPTAIMERLERELAEARRALATTQVALTDAMRSHAELRAILSAPAPLSSEQRAGRS